MVGGGSCPGCALPWATQLPERLINILSPLQSSPQAVVCSLSPQRTLSCPHGRGARWGGVSCCVWGQLDSTAGVGLGWPKEDPSSLHSSAHAAGPCYCPASSRKPSWPSLAAV